MIFKLQGNDSSILKTANISTSSNNTSIVNTTALSWGNMLTWIRKEGSIIDVTALFSVVKENIGILMSVSIKYIPLQ